MTIISRRILKPILGKSKTALERSTKYKDIMVSNGVKARLGMFVGGELNGSIQLTAAYADMTSATKSFADLSKNKETRGKICQIRMHIGRKLETTCILHWFFGFSSQ